MKAILIVEDDPIGSRLLLTMLQLEGYQVYRLGDWGDLLNCVEQYQPTLVIMDVHLHDHDGFELLSQLRTHSDPDVARTPVLMTSGFDYGYRCKQAGADGFLRKPFSTQEMMAAVQKIEEGRVWDD